MLYDSGREWLLRAVAGVSFLPVGLAAWLLPLAPREEWAQAPLGGIAWWLLPAGLTLLTLVLPASLFLLHRRYLLRLTLDADGQLTVTTFLVWGRHTRRCRPGAFDGGGLILDRHGRAPHGLEAVRDPSEVLVRGTPPKAERFTARRIHR